MLQCIPLCSRVKELGPGGPVEGKSAEVAQDYHPADGTSPQNSDLAMLKTSNVSETKGMFP